MKIVQAEFIKGIRGTNLITDEPVAHIAFLGRSNVGKSSLINMLVDRKSLVKSSATPGKTKEINYFKINNDFYFVDLPGYGYAKLSHKERDKLRKLIWWYITDTNPEMRTFVLVLDAQVGITEHDQEILDLLEEMNASVILALNKSDKLNQSDKHRVQREMQGKSEYPLVMTSSTKKKGKMELLETLFA